MRLKYPVIHFSFQNSFPVRIFIVLLQVYEGVSQLPSEIQSIKYDEATPDKIEAVKKVYGERFLVRTSLPAVLSVNFGCNVPRLATLRSTRAAKNKPLAAYTNADLNLPEDQVGIKGSPTAVIDSFEPTGGRMAEMLTGTPEELAVKLKDLIDEEKGNL